MTIKRNAAIKKRPSAVKKGREGCHGRLVHAGDIKKGLEDGRGFLEGQEGHSGHLVLAADIKKGLEDGCGLLEGHEGNLGHLSLFS